MAKDPDFERIRRKAHELWEAEGHPHGRDQDHWDAAKEMVAIEDSQDSTLLPRETGAEPPSEPQLAVDSMGDMPGLTDQGRNDLTDTDREPTPAVAKKAGAKVAAPKAPEPPKAAQSPKMAEAPKAAQAPKPVAAQAKAVAPASEAVVAPSAAVGKKPAPAGKKKV